MTCYELDDGEKINSEHPETFSIPSKLKRENLTVGNIVKLIFRISVDDGDVEVERMWVNVTEVLGHGKYVGKLDNNPMSTDELSVGSIIPFEAKHVINIY